MDASKKEEIINQLTHGFEDIALMRLKRLFANEPAFFESFVVEESIYQDTIIEYDQIVGTKHPDYREKTWLNLLNNGKRMSINLPLLIENPDYYLQLEKKEQTPSYMKEEDGLYIYYDGNHRSCIANFFLRGKGIGQFGKVDVYEKKRDQTFLEIFCEIKEYIESNRKKISVQPQRKDVSRDDGAGWKKDFYDVTLRVINMKTGVSGIIKPDEAEKYLEKLKKPGMFSFFRRSGDFTDLV